MRTLLVSIALLVAGAQAVAADGWGNCKNCSAGADGASVGGGLALLAGVAYAIGRRRQR
jgi:MYXO-CTERM domain-containing protein